MKKYITSFLLMAMVAVMIPFMSTSASAQTRRYYNNNRRVTRTYSNPYSSYNRNYDRGNVYDKHRNLINIGIGTAAGAILGGLIGG